MTSGWYTYAGDLEQGYELFMRLLSLSPFDEGYLKWLAFVLEKSSRYTEAIARIEERLRHNDDVTGDWWVLGRLYEKTGDKAAAAHCLREAALRSPTANWTNNTLTALLGGDQPDAENS